MPRCHVLAAICLAGLAGFAAPLATRSAAAAPTMACERSGEPDEGGGVPVCIGSTTLEADLCAAIETFAIRHSLPSGFLARLIWQESLFDPEAVSYKGALGIAQFMPGTARLRGLADPFNPADALAKSAAYLAELARRFGSLGLAAAAYNGGENRVERLLAGAASRLPVETEDYVLVITGRTVAEWREGSTATVDFDLEAGTPFRPACLTLAATRELKRELAPQAAWRPWGVHLGSHFSRSVARRYFRLLKARYPSLLGEAEALIVADRKLSRGPRIRFALRVGKDSRREAYLLCGRLRALGGFCTVARN